MINFTPLKNMEIWYKISIVLVVSMIINKYAKDKFSISIHLNNLKVK